MLILCFNNCSSSNSFHIDSYNQLRLSNDLFSETSTQELVVPRLVAERLLSTEWRKHIIWRVEGVQVYHLTLQISQKRLLKKMVVL